ncbi:hypothetical protein JTE90_013694 [Oedothorax gibbosus]|uniref:Uncharacterized protein n=1 Tax=Oedothorax gibbosus TaxID=931172 RepID=A0AAV6TJP3_9ARAC|nr:hypothetical protein JTE90_013694 [Oedothorax gibbosus]
MSIGRYYGPLLLCVFLLQLSSCRALRCTDEENQEVDWYSIQTPKLEAATRKAASGAPKREKPTLNIPFPGSLGGLENVPNGVRPRSPCWPKLESSVVAFDGKSGFWLVHSIPKAFGPTGYVYPDNALSYGQSVLCVTLTVHSLDEIWESAAAHPPLHLREPTHRTQWLLPVPIPPKTLFGKGTQKTL